MIRDYLLVSPSLDGVMSHDSLTYEGLKRPAQVLRVLDGPATKGARPASGSRTAADIKRSEEDQKVLEDYFHDLYGVFMKKLSFFIVASEVSPEDSLKLQAMLQEMIKIKGLMGMK